MCVGVCGGVGECVGVRVGLDVEGDPCAKGACVGGVCLCVSLRLCECVVAQVRAKVCGLCCLPLM